jgi:hypothetical protein
MTNRWMRGVVKRPTESGRIRLAWAKQKGSIKRQGFVRHSWHEGLAPVRLCNWARNRFGPFAGAFYAGHRIDRPVFFCRSLGSWSMDPRSPFALLQLAAARSVNGARASAILMTAPALRLLRETGQTRNKDKKE